MPKFAEFKRLQQRMRNSLHCRAGAQKNRLTQPVSNMVVDYFDKNCSFDYLDINFATNLSQDAYVSPCGMLIAMIYIDRLKKCKNPEFQNSNPAELYLSALVLATKYLNDGGLDEFIWNDEWAATSGFALSKLNELELDLLCKLNWDIFVSEKTFDDALNSFENWVASDLFLQNGQLTYKEVLILTRNNQWLKESIQHFLKFVAYIALIYISITLSAIFVSTTVLNAIGNAQLNYNVSQPNDSFSNLLHQHCSSSFESGNFPLFEPCDHIFENRSSLATSVILNLNLPLFSECSLVL